jgi:ketosteroid isomerase-like protein
MPGTTGTGTALELTSRVFAAANARDYESMLGLFGPDSVWDTSPWGLGTHRGPDAIRRFLELWVGAFEKWSITPGAAVDLGNGVVCVASVQTGMSRGSPNPFRLGHTSVFVWSEGVALQALHFRELDDALRVARRITGEPA